jgi:fatty-acyl-CoA synthase
VLLGPSFDALAPALDEHGMSYRVLSDLVDGESAELPEPVQTGEDDTALLQLTSGSTAEPKAVRISHRNLHANMTAVIEAAALDREADMLVSWGSPRRPTSPTRCWAAGWRGRTRSCAWTRCASRSTEPSRSSPQRCGRSPARARVFGLDPRSVVCAYGMAETALAVSFAPRGVGMQVDTIDAEEFESRGRAVPTGRSDEDSTRSFPLLGPPLPGIELQVVDDAGMPLRIAPLLRR